MNNRRDFFRKLGIGAIASAVVPQVATLKMTEEIATEHLPISGQQFYHFEETVSDYDVETYRRLHELVERQAKTKIRL